MICQEIMTREMTVISPQTKGREILRLLAEDPGRPLIVANEAGFLLGVVTARDFLRLHLDWVKDGLFLDPAADDDACCASGPVEQIAECDLAVAVDGIALQCHRASEGGTRKGQGQCGPQDQRPHDFTCEATDSIWSAVVMTLEFIS